MPTVNIVAALAGKSEFGNRMVISTTDRKHAFACPTAPVNIQYFGYGFVWTEVPRAGKMPYLLMESWQLPKISFTIQIARETDPDYDCTGGLKQLGYMSASTSPIRIKYGGYFENRSWRMTKLDFNSLRRHPTTNVITWAEINLEFTMAQDVVLSTGPVTGGVRR